MSLILEALKKVQKIKMDRDKHRFSINLPWVSQWNKRKLPKKLFLSFGGAIFISLLTVYYYNYNYNILGFPKMAKKSLSLPLTQSSAVVTEGPLTLKEVSVDSWAGPATLIEVPKPSLQKPPERVEASVAKIDRPKETKILPGPTPEKIKPSPSEVKLAKKEAKDFSPPTPEPKKAPVQTEQEPSGEKRLSIQTIPAGEAINHFNLGLLYHKNHKLLEALEEYKKAIQIDRFNVGAHNNLGMAYKDLGRYEEAISQYQEALSIDSKYDKARHNLAVAYYSQGNLEKAAVEFNLAIASNPKGPESYNNLGLLYKKLKKFPEAREVFQKGLSIAPSFPSLHYNLALTLEEEGDLQGAISHYQKFVELSAEDQKVLIAKVKRHLESLSHGR